MGLFSRDPDDDDDDAGDGTRFWEERGFVAAAIVIGAVLVCLLVWFFLRGDSGTPTTASSVTPTNVIPTEQSTEQASEEPSVPPATPTEVPIPGSTTTPTTPPPLNSATGGCRNRHPDQREPVAAPPAVSWQFAGDLLIPLQAAGGPATTSPSGVHSCFAHSQTGAVLATMVLLGQVANRSMTEEVLRTRCLPGPGQTQALADFRTPATTPSEKTQVQFAGFKILDYESDRAILQIAVQLNHQSYGSLPVTMKWSGGDWKAVLRANGSFNGTVAPDVLSSLDGYVRFQAAA
jgi:hypothetical protein